MANEISILDVRADNREHRRLGHYGLRLGFTPPDWYFDILNFTNVFCPEYLDIDRDQYRAHGYGWDHLDRAAEYGIGHHSRISQDPEDLAALGIGLKGHDIVKGGKNDAFKSAVRMGELLGPLRKKYPADKHIQRALDTALMLIGAHESYKSVRLLERQKSLINSLDPQQKGLIEFLTNRIKQLRYLLPSNHEGRYEKLAESFYLADVVGRALKYRVVLCAYNYIHNTNFETGDNVRLEDIDDFLRKKWYLARPEELEGLDSIIVASRRIFVDRQKLGKLDSLVQEAIVIENEEIEKRLSSLSEQDKELYSGLNDNRVVV